MVARLIIASSKEQILEEVTKILSEVGITNPHPDLLYLDPSQKLGIDTARKIKQTFSIKPHSLKGRTVVLEDASKLTYDAQNSLLKTLEELPANSSLILGANSTNYFLPTVLSRCQIIKLDNSPANENHIASVVVDEIEKLMTAEVADKFEYIEKLKNKPQFLLDLTVFFRAKMIEKPHSKQISEYLKKLMQAQEWAGANVNIRAILEYLMLEIPTG